MKNQITIDSKIGYLRPHTGRYDFAVVVGITNDKLTLRKEVKQGKNHNWVNTWEEKISDVIQWLKTPSQEFKDQRPLLKHKGTTKNY